MLNRVIWLIISLILIFTLAGMLLVPQVNPLGAYAFHPWLVPITAIATALILAVPFLRQQTLVVNVLIWTALWAVIRIFIPASAPAAASFSPILWMAEWFFLLIIVYLAHLLAAYLSQVEKIIESSLIAPPRHRVFDLTHEGPVIEEEFSRSRRLEYPISAVVFNIDATRSDKLLPARANLFIEEIARSVLSSYVFSRLVKIIDDQIRYMDMIVRIEENGRFALICPDLTAENAAKFAHRLETAVHSKLGIHLTFGAATFPHEAPTLRSLLNQAEAKLYGQPLSPAPESDGLAQRSDPTLAAPGDAGSDDRDGADGFSAPSQPDAPTSPRR